MAQWTNLQRIERFEIQRNHALPSEKSGGLHLAELGLMPGSLADKIWTRLEILKACCRSIFDFV